MNKTVHLNSPSLRLALFTTDNRENNRDYATPLPYFGAAPTALLEGFAALPNLEVHIISCTQQPMSSPAKLANNIWFHSLHVPKIGWLRLGYSGCILAIRKKLKEIQPDIVHGQGTERDCGISAVFSGFPNVITIHGNMAELGRIFHAHFASFHWWAAKLENFTLPRTLGVLCNSFHTQFLVTPRAKATWLVPNALRTAFLENFRYLSADLIQPTILVIGVITPNKRQLELLTLLASLRQQVTNFQVKFVGSSNDSTYNRGFFNKISERSISSWATWLGVLDEPALIHCMDSAHALLHFPQEEAFGLVVAESLARGLKLFASNVGGIRDITSGVSEAELFESEDWDGLARALTAWIQRPSLSQPQTQNLMKSRYHPKTIASRHLEIYREVLSANTHS